MPGTDRTNSGGTGNDATNLVDGGWAEETNRLKNDLPDEVREVLDTAEIIKTTLAARENPPCLTTSTKRRSLRKSMSMLIWNGVYAFNSFYS